MDELECDADSGTPLPTTEPSTAIGAKEGRDIVVIGASAGGIDALKRLTAALPATYDGAVFVVLHIGAESTFELPGILGRSGPLPAVAAADSMPIVRGRVHVAPPDHHLLVERGQMRTVRGPRENRHRPAIDPLFRSAAWAYGPRVVGVVLTGNLDDGTAGLWAIKSCGGTTIVQEPNDARYPEMPFNALMHNRVDHRLPLEEIAPLLVRLANEPSAANRPRDPLPTLEDEIEYAKMNRALHMTGGLGQLSPFTCPTCRGALWELQEGGHLRYRCHTGHAFSHPSLLIEQGLAAEESLYAAMRALEEKAATLRRLAERWPESVSGIGQDYKEQARSHEKSASVLRAMLAGAKV